MHQVRMPLTEISRCEIAPRRRSGAEKKQRDARNIPSFPIPILSINDAVKCRGTHEGAKWEALGGVGLAFQKLCGASLRMGGVRWIGAPSLN